MDLIPIGENIVSEFASLLKINLFALLCMKFCDLYPFLTHKTFCEFLYFRWCSLFNADLALSVTMTAISTLLSVVMLPINLLIYSKYAFDDDVIGNLQWGSLFTSLVVVISAISLGLFASDRLNSHNFNIHANKVNLSFQGKVVVFHKLYFCC